MTDLKERSDNIRPEIITELKILKRKYPESAEINEAISIVENNLLSDEILFEIRSVLRTALIKKEHNFISFVADMDALIFKIFDFSEAEQHEKEDCFPPGFDFIRGRNFYFLAFPRLKKKLDLNAKTEKMMDGFIQNGIHDSLARYEKGRSPFEKFESYSLIFIHYFTEDQKDLFDTDNIDIKKPIDAVNGVLIQNDTVSRSHIYQITRKADREYTELYILKGHDLSDAILANLARIIGNQNGF